MELKNQKSFLVQEKWKARTPGKTGVPAFPAASTENTFNMLYAILTFTGWKMLLMMSYNLFSQPVF